MSRCSKTFDRQCTLVRLRTTRLILTEPHTVKQRLNSASVVCMALGRGFRSLIPTTLFTATQPLKSLSPMKLFCFRGTEPWDNGYQQTNLRGLFKCDRNHTIERLCLLFYRLVTRLALIRYNKSLFIKSIPRQCCLELCSEVQRGQGIRGVCPKVSVDSTYCHQMASVHLILNHCGRNGGGIPN